MQHIHFSYCTRYQFGCLFYVCNVFPKFEVANVLNYIDSTSGLLFFSFHATFAFQHVVVKTCPCVGEWQFIPCDSIKKVRICHIGKKKRRLYSPQKKNNKQTKVWDYEGLFVRDTN